MNEDKLYERNIIEILRNQRENESEPLLKNTRGEEIEEDQIDLQKFEE